MILFDIAVEAFFFFIAAVVIILLIGAAGLVFIILREVAWYVRKQNEKVTDHKVIYTGDDDFAEQCPLYENKWGYEEKSREPQRGSR